MQLIGNTGDLIDWDKVIESIKHKSGNLIRYNDYTFTPHFKGFSDMNKMWQDAGYTYDDPCIEWINYFPEEHFDGNISNIFRDLVNVKMQPFMVWISKIKPCRMAPWHFDAHKHIDYVMSIGKPIRYVCYIGKPADGHVSIVKDHFVYKPEQGSVYLWDNYNDFHCGLNGGLSDKYMFNYWGYIPPEQTEG